MTILVMTIPVTFLLVTFFIVSFIVATKNDQFTDLETPAHSMLMDSAEANIDKVNSKKRDEKNDGSTESKKLLR